MSKVRNSNLELYRIIVMLLIVAHHYVVNSGLLGVMVETPLSLNSIFFYLFGAWGQDWHKLFPHDYRIFHVQVSDYMAKVSETTA